MISAILLLTNWTSYLDSGYNLLLEKEGDYWLLRDGKISSNQLQNSLKMNNILPEYLGYSPLESKWLLSSRKGGSIFLWDDDYQFTEEAFRFEGYSHLSFDSIGSNILSIADDGAMLVRERLKVVVHSSNAKTTVVADAPDFALGWLLVRAAKEEYWCMIPQSNYDSPMSAKASLYYVTKGRSEYYGTVRTISRSADGGVSCIVSRGSNPHNAIIVWRQNDRTMGIKSNGSVIASVLNSKGLFLLYSSKGELRKIGSQSVIFVVKPLEYLQERD